MTEDLQQCVDPHRGATFTFGNRARRAIWGFVYLFFFRTSPRPFHQWRSMLLSAFGAKMGKNCHIYPKARIWAPWNLVVEDEGSAGDDALLYSMATITIGRRAIVSQGAHLCTGTHDYTDPAFQLVALPISIGPEAWICTEAFIGPGVTIGEGTVIGARSVATKSMPAWSVCAGTPCRVIKPRILKSASRSDQSE